ncbi:hypothetical protein VXE32_004517 [Burkholderia cepacia]|nr:hypothetical protein [Burkholderia cepacia]
MAQTAGDVFSKVRSAVADVRTGLVRFEQMLDSFESGTEQVSRGYLDLISTLMLRGSVDVWYHGEYIAVPFHRLPEWFRDPTAIVAEHFRVTAATFRQWVDHELDCGAGVISIPCNHPNCRLIRKLAFSSPREMQMAEAKAASEIWYCHRHRMLAWQSERALGTEHLAILRRVRDSPGCTRQRLGAKKGETDFLVSIGLLIEQLPGASRTNHMLAFHLTSQGQRIALAHETL